MSVELRHTVKDVQRLIHDYNFLWETGIRTIPQLDIYIEDTERQIKEYETERSRLRNKVRREKDPAIFADNKASRSEITKNKIEPLRNSLKYAKRLFQIMKKHSSAAEKIVLVLCFLFGMNRYPMPADCQAEAEYPERISV